MNLTQYMRIPVAWRAPLVAHDGMGVDSTGYLEGLRQLGIRPDAILHADTGDEHKETVAYRETRREWLAKVGFPDLTIVKRAPSVQGNRKRRDGKVDVTYSSLGENCLANATLPGLAFGGKSCSAKWKIEPQNAWIAQWEPARRAWAHGLPVVELIGYDAGPADARRAHNLAPDHRHTYIYPLREWGWDRERCVAEIRAAGIKLPRKSACIFCPASKTWEIAMLVRDYPDDADRIILIEDTARPNLRGIDGLWRAPVKGARGAVARPGSMAQFIHELRADPALMKRHLALAPTYAAGDCGAGGCGL